MSFEPRFPGLFEPEQPQLPMSVSAPSSEKQQRYAQVLAERVGEKIPPRILHDRAQISAWIDAHKPKTVQGRFSNYPSSKQVAFAERIARIKQRDIPRECFQDKSMMSRWIDGNKPR